jgi:hypothetical protein
LFYDSNNAEFKIDGGTLSAIEDVTFSCEAENWARKYRIIIADVEGEALPIANSYEANEFRHAGLIINGQNHLTGNGFIEAAERNGMSAVEYGQALKRNYARVESTGVITATDGWPLLDEHVIRKDLILDGLRVGAALRLLMHNAGWGTSELTGIDDDFGVIISQAAPGENPCRVARKGAFTGPELRSLMDDYTLGAILFHDFNGVWRIYEPSESPILTLSRDATVDSRLKYYAPLDFTRDASNCYNDFLVEGVGPNGEPLGAWWTIWAGFQRGFGVLRDPRFIGRKRSYIPGVDDGLRTQAEVDYRLRCLVARYGGSARFTSCTTHWWRDMLPGQTIALTREVAGSLQPVRYKVQRIGGASAYDDRMEVVLQEKVPLPPAEIVIDEE